MEKVKEIMANVLKALDFRGHLKYIPHVLFFSLCVKFFFSPASFAEVLAMIAMGAYVFFTGARTNAFELSQLEERVNKQINDMHIGLLEQKKFLEENRNAIASVKLQTGVKTQSSIRF